MKRRFEAAEAKGPRETRRGSPELEDTRAQLVEAQEKLKSLGEDTPPRKSFMAYDYPAMGKTLEDDARIQKKVESFKRFRNLRKHQNNSTHWKGIKNGSFHRNHNLPEVSSGG